MAERPSAITMTIAKDGEAAYAMDLVRWMAEAKAYMDALEADNERLRELVAGPDDGRCWYSRSLLDEVVAERDEWKRRAEEATEIIRIFMDEYVNRYGIDGAYDEPMERGRTLLARYKEANSDT